MAVVPHIDRCDRLRRRKSVIEMPRTASISYLGSEFDDFLFAPIGEERNGMPLSVVSALARSDVDPWQEAAQLDRLPVEAATQRLASLIAALPEASGPRWDPGIIATRLIGLLPHTAASPSPSSKAVLDADAANRSQIMVYVIFMVIALSVQWIATSHQSPAQVSDRNPPASSTLSHNTQAPPAHR
jgi:hypothetical protein